MAHFREPTKGDLSTWRKWVKKRPSSIRALIRQRGFNPWTLYRLKNSGHRVALCSFIEPGGAPDQHDPGCPKASEGCGYVNRFEGPSVTVSVDGRFNAVGFERRVAILRRMHHKVRRCHGVAQHKFEALRRRQLDQQPIVFGHHQVDDVQQYGAVDAGEVSIVEPYGTGCILHFKGSNYQLGVLPIAADEVRELLKNKPAAAETTQELSAQYLRFLSWLAKD